MVDVPAPEARVPPLICHEYVHPGWAGTDAFQPDLPVVTGEAADIAADGAGSTVRVFRPVEVPPTVQLSFAVPAGPEV